MGTIAQELTRIQTAKSDLKTSIEAKGVTVPANALIDSYSGYVDQISQGGAVTHQSKSVTITTNTTTTVEPDVGYDYLDSVEVITNVQPVTETVTIEVYLVSDNHPGRMYRTTNAFSIYYVDMTGSHTLNFDSSEQSSAQWDAGIHPFTVPKGCSIYTYSIPSISLPNSVRNYSDDNGVSWSYGGGSIVQNSTSVTITKPDGTTTSKGYVNIWLNSQNGSKVYIPMTQSQ